MRIAVLDDYQQAAAGFADWASLDAEVDFVTDHLAGDELVGRIGGCDVVVLMRERTVVDASLLDRLPALRLLVTTGMRNAALDLAAAAERGVRVCGTRGFRHNTTELTWALVMACVRPVGDHDAQLRRGGWQTRVDGDLAGRTLGVVGLGTQGAGVARIARAFDMAVLAWSPHLSAERAAEHGATAVERDELFRRADVVSLHLVLSGTTRGVVGAEQLRLMKPTAYLINTARAGLVDPAALRQAIEEGWFAGAALDVFDEEPLPVGHWLRSAPRTVLTPHMGYVTGDGYRIFFADVVEDIAAFAAGSPVRLLS